MRDTYSSEDTYYLMIFTKLVEGIFDFNNIDESFEFSQNFVYDLAYSIGKSDAINFATYASCDDKIALDNACLVYMAYTGIAFVELLEESVFSDDVNQHMVAIEFIYGFESEAWNKENKFKGCKCVFSAGYFAGWGESITGVMQATGEILCKSKGDDRCLFIRTVPYMLEEKITEYCDKHNINHYEGLPRFLKNRKETLPKRIQLELLTKDDKNWLQKNYKKIKKEKEGRKRKNSKKKSYESLTSYEELHERASEALSQFFIDPVSGTVELAGDKCVLIRGNALSYDFFDFISELVKGKPTDHCVFVSNFLFDFGKSIGKSNHNWFVDRIKLSNPIDRANAMSVCMQNFGWSDISVSELSVDILKKRDELVIKCSCTSSFEASAWIKKKKKTNYPMCFMHCGFIAGWLQKCFDIKLACIEITCRAKGDKSCQFIVATPDKIEKEEIDPNIISLFSFQLNKENIPPISKEVLDEIYTLRQNIRKNIKTPNSKRKRLSNEIKKNMISAPMQRSSSLMLSKY